MTDSKKYLLCEDRIPKAWYNVAADLSVPPPAVLHPGTGQPIGPGDLAPLFPMAVIMREVWNGESISPSRYATSTECGAYRRSCRRSVSTGALSGGQQQQLAIARALTRS